MPCRNMKTYSKLYVKHNMEFLNFIVPFKIFFRKRIKNLRTMKSFYFSYTVFFSKCGV